MKVAAVTEFCIVESLLIRMVQAEVESIVSAVPFVIWPGYANKKHQLCPVAALNAFFAASFKRAGWAVETELGTGDKPDAFKVFGDLRVAVEVQFGNHARDEADVLKFLRLLDSKSANLFIRIALDQATGQMCASGIATAKHFNQTVVAMRGRYDAPTLSLTVSETGVERLNISDCGVPKNQLKNRSHHPRLQELAEITHPPKQGVAFATRSGCQLELFPPERPSGGNTSDPSSEI